MAATNSLSFFKDTTLLETTSVQIDLTAKTVPSGRSTLQDSTILQPVKSERNTILLLESDSTNSQVNDLFNLVNNQASTTANPNSMNHFVREEGNVIVSDQNSWVVAVLLFALILLAIVRFSFGKFLNRVFDSLINPQTTSNLFVEKNMRNLRGAIFMNALFFVTTSLFLVQYATMLLFQNKIENNFISFLYCLLGLMGLYSGKYLVIRFIGYIFKGIKESKEYIHTVFIYNKNLGVFLFPVTMSVPFVAEYAVPLLLNAGLLIVFIFYLFRLVRGFKILFRQHVSIFYMILYLCALEILPLLMIYKLLNSLA